MRISRVALLDAEAMRLLPLHAVRAPQNDDRRRGMNHVASGAASESEPKLLAEPAQVGEGIVFAVVKNAPHGNHLHCGRLRVGGCADRECARRHQKDGQTPQPNEAMAFHKFEAYGFPPKFSYVITAAPGCSEMAPGRPLATSSRPVNSRRASGSSRFTMA